MNVTGECLGTPNDEAVLNDQRKATACVNLSMLVDESRRKALETNDAQFGAVEGSKDSS